MATDRFRLLLLTSLLSTGTCAAETLYKSIDEQGHVTYSSNPPANAVETQDVQIAPGPSPEEAEQARERSKAMEQEADNRYREVKDRRQQEEEARKEAGRERMEKETAERQRRIDEALQRIESERPYVRPYPYDWRWPNRPYPPIHPPFPPGPVYPVAPRNRPYEDHINPPTRNP